MVISHTFGLKQSRYGAIYLYHRMESRLKWPRKGIFVCKDCPLGTVMTWQKRVEGNFKDAVLLLRWRPLSTIFTKVWCDNTYSQKERIKLYLITPRFLHVSQFVYIVIRGQAMFSRKGSPWGSYRRDPLDSSRCNRYPGSFALSCATSFACFLAIYFLDLGCAFMLDIL